MTGPIADIPQILRSGLAFGLPGHGEWIILLVLGLLIFGRRLPEVGRSLGRGIVEFKKGIRGIEDEIEDESSPKSGKKIGSTVSRGELPDTEDSDEVDETTRSAKEKTSTS